MRAPSSLARSWICTKVVPSDIGLWFATHRIGFQVGKAHKLISNVRALNCDSVRADEPEMVLRPGPILLWNSRALCFLVITACGARSAIDGNQIAPPEMHEVTNKAHELPGVEWLVTERFDCIDEEFAKPCQRDTDCCTHSCVDYADGKKRCFGYAPPNHPCGNLPQCEKPYSWCQGVRFCASGICECESSDPVLIDDTQCIGMCTLSAPGGGCRNDDDCVVAPCVPLPLSSRPEGQSGTCVMCSSDADCPDSTCNTLYGACESWYDVLRQYLPDDDGRYRFRWPW